MYYPRKENLMQSIFGKFTNCNFRFMYYIVDFFRFSSQYLKQHISRNSY